MTITAKYDGTCRGCGGPIRKGEKIEWTKKEGAFHQGCKPSGPGGRVSREDREYYAGRADAQRYLDDRRIYGEELAEQWEIERELREDW